MSMLENYGEIMLVEEVCEVLRIGSAECYKLLNNNHLCGYKVGKTWRIPKKNLEAYINDRIK